MSSSNLDFKLQFITNKFMTFKDFSPFWVSIFIYKVEKPSFFLQSGSEDEIRRHV